MAFFGGNKRKQETLPTSPAVSTQNRNGFSAASPSKVRVPTGEARIEGIGWLGLKAADVVGEALFLEKKLGLKLQGEGNTAVGHHVIYDCETLLLELVEGGSVWASRPKPRRGSPDIPLIPSFGIDRIEDAAQNLQNQEVVLTRIFDQGWAASLLFVDNERNLWQASETRNAPPAGTFKFCRIEALWLAVEDYPAQVAFYRDVLGLPLTDLGNRPRPVTENSLHGHEGTENAAAAKIENQPGFEPLSSLDELELPEPLFRVDADTTNLGDGAAFFEAGARLALSPGGHKTENGGEKQWGLDTAFLPGFRTNNLAGMAQKLREAGIKVQEPERVRRPTSLYRTDYLRFSDPEGNLWQVSE